MVESYSNKKDIHWTDDFSNYNLITKTKCFNDNNINSAMCGETLVQLTYFLGQRIFTPKEQSDIFFSVTKLFRSNDLFLRRFLYLIISSIKHDPDYVFMALSALIKDLTSFDSPKMFRANAIKAISFVVDKNSFGDINQYLKQSVVSKESFLQSSALAVGIKLFESNSSLISKWNNEVNDAFRNCTNNGSLQLLSLVLLCKIKLYEFSSWEEFVIRTITHFIEHPHIYCKCGNNHRVVQTFFNCAIAEFTNNNTCSDTFIERLKEVCYKLFSKSKDNSLHYLFNFGVKMPISFFDLEYCSKVKTFATLRTVCKALNKNKYLKEFVQDFHIERLLKSSNTAILYYSIKLQLKLSPFSVSDRTLEVFVKLITNLPVRKKNSLIKLVSTALENKQSIQAKFLNQISIILRTKQEVETKRVIVDAFLYLIQQKETLREMCLQQLCEFIEDCEYPSLMTQIIFIIGEEGPKTTNPSVYVRYLANRILLELPSVRCAAIDALGKFGLCEKLTKNVVLFLKRSLKDNNEEVRERAHFNLYLIKNQEVRHTAKKFKSQDLENLKYSLMEYLKSDLQKAFTLDDVGPVKKEEGIPGSSSSKNDIETSSKNDETTEIEKEIKGLGEKIGESDFTNMSEREDEYFTKCKTIMYETGAVLEFFVTNTVANSVIYNVSVNLDEISPFSILKATEIESLEYGKTKSQYTAVKFPLELIPISTSCKLVFKSKSVSSVLEEYPLEDLTLDLETQYFPHKMSGIEEFKREWKNLVAYERKIKTECTAFKESMKKLIKELGLSLVQNEGHTEKLINLSGVTIFENEKVKVLSRILLRDSGRNTVVHMSVRSKNEKVIEILVNKLTARKSLK